MSKPEDDGYKALEAAFQEMLEKSPVLRKYFQMAESRPKDKEHQAWLDSINARLTRLEEAVMANKDKYPKEKKDG